MLSRSILGEEYQTFEMRFCEKIIAGVPKLLKLPNNVDQDRVLTFIGNKLGYKHIIIELDSSAARDELLDGLRLMRCAYSTLFTQWLAKHIELGKR